MTFYESELIEAITQENLKNFNDNGGLNMYTHKLTDEDIEREQAKLLNDENS